MSNKILRAAVVLILGLLIAGALLSGKGPKEVPPGESPETPIVGKVDESETPVEGEKVETPAEVTETPSEVVETAVETPVETASENPVVTPGTPSVENPGKTEVPAVTPTPTPNPTPTNPTITTKMLNVTEVIRFKTIRQNDSTLESGKTVTAQKGQDGLLTITYQLTLENGVEKGRVEQKRVVTKSPVDEIIKVGTKTTTVVTPPAPVVTVKNEVKTESIAYTTERRNDATLAAGTEVVQQEGKNGVRTITYKVTYTDGKETSRTIASDVVTTQPVNKVILVGTKVGSVYDPYVKGILPSGYTMSDEGMPRGVGGIYKGTKLVGELSVGTITAYTGAIPHNEQRELVKFFGRFRINIGRGDDMVRLLNLFDSWTNPTIIDTPSYGDVYWLSGQGYFKISYRD